MKCEVAKLLTALSCTVVAGLLLPPSHSSFSLQTLDHPQHRSLSDVLSSPDSALAYADIAEINLVSAEGLPGAGSSLVKHCLTQLDQWATHARFETEQNFYRFRNAPEEYDSSEAYFRMLMLSVIVYEDFGVRYNPERISNPEIASSTADSFFADSRDVFIHGLISDRRLGTCSSMPVLYVALGRRLGYPLKLVTTKAHLFVRWDSPTERLYPAEEARLASWWEHEMMGSCKQLLIS